MCERLKLTPEPGKWYVSEGHKVARLPRKEPGHSRVVGEVREFNGARYEMIVAGPFNTEAEAVAALPALATCHDPYAWQEDPAPSAS